VQFAGLDAYDSDGDRAAIGGLVADACATTCRFATGRAAVTDVRAR
jgi:hypothetical protein